MIESKLKLKDAIICIHIPSSFPHWDPSPKKDFHTSIKRKCWAPDGQTSLLSTY